MIRNIVFDMGQVIIRFDPQLFLDRFSINATERELLRNEIFNSVEWVMTDHGILDATGAAENIKKRLPEHLHSIADNLICHWFEPLLIVEEIEPFIRELKENGYTIWLLSNAGTNQPVYWEKVPFHGLFNGTMISAEIGMMKPDPRIYRCFTERFELNPDECLFIDDNPSNVEAAVCCGWKGIIFHGNVSELREKACKLGVQCFI